jgi:hypothetical protein
MILEFFISVNLSHDLPSVSKENHRGHTSQLENLVLLKWMIRPSTPLLLFDKALDYLFFFRNIFDEGIFNGVLCIVTIAAPCLAVLFVSNTSRENAYNELLASFGQTLESLFELRWLSYFNYLRSQMRLQSI